MYSVNPERPDILLNVVRTFRYKAEERNDPREDTPCVELRSDDGRYNLICTAEQFSTLTLVD
jgi:hypothetical protein